MPSLQIGNSQTVLARLKANTEQCVRVDTDRTHNGTSNQWQGSSEDNWYVKPGIRIDSSVAHLQQNPAICEIKVFADDGNGHQILKKDVVLYAKNFLDANLNYNGRYLEEFYNHLPSDTVNLTFHGDLGGSFGFAARGNAAYDNGCSTADIQVIWSGNYDMWIDYVKVQSDVADGLFKGYYEGLDPNHPERHWIQDEVNAVMSSGVPAVYNFYIELPNFNNIPCMGYLNHKIDSLSNHQIGLMGEMVCQFNLQLSWADRGSIVSPQQMKKMFTDSSHSNCVFLGDPYPIAADAPKSALVAS